MTLSTLAQTLRTFQFLEAVQKKLGTEQKVLPQSGYKFIKVIARAGGSATILCYVDTSNGNILRAVGVKGVLALNQVRGNINKADYDVSIITPAGIAPLKRGRKALKAVKTIKGASYARMPMQSRQAEKAVYHGTY